MPDILLSARRLSHAFDYPLYHNVSLEIGRGESVAVMGRSGSGKSTLLHTLAGLIEPREGEVLLFGESLRSMDEQRMEMLRRYKTGIVFQAHYLFKGMTGRDNIEIAAMLAGRSTDEAILKRLGIDLVLAQKVSELSGGQQQRVSLARVLSKKPKIVFADEPTGNLDAETSSLVMDVLMEYVESEKAALFMVTHDPEVAYRCGRVYYLDRQELRPSAAS